MNDQMKDEPKRRPFEGKRMPAWLGCPLFAILGGGMAWLSFVNIRDGTMSTGDCALLLLLTVLALLISVLFGAGL